MEGNGKEFELDVLTAKDDLTEGLHYRTIAKMARCKGILTLKESMHPKLRNRDTN